MRKAFLLSLLFAPMFAQASVGIPSGVLWCSKLDVVAGDEVTCSTVVVNPEAVEARGTVEFLINAKVFDSKQVFVPAGSYKNVDFQFKATEGKQEYLARVVQGQFYDKENIPIPATGTKTPLVTSAIKTTVTKYVPPPTPAPTIATTTASGAKATFVGTSTPLDTDAIETKIHDILPEKVATPVSSVTVPVVSSLEAFRTGQDASNLARINALTKELSPVATSTKPVKGSATSSTSTSVEVSPWSLLGDNVKSGKAIGSPWSHMVLLCSLIWDIVVHTWWVFYVVLAGIAYEAFVFARNRWRGYD